MVKRYIIILAVFAIGICNFGYSQDAHFSQYYSNPLYLNPALAGAENCPRITLNYRNQWPGLGQTYVTYSLGYDQFVSAIHGGIGVHLLHDVEANGALSTSEINAMYAYTLQLNHKFYLTGGLQASFFMHHVNYDFVFPDMIHPLYGPIYGSQEPSSLSNPYKNHPDFSLGLLGYTEKTFLGVAVHHITKPSVSFLKGSSDASLLPKVTVHFGTEFDLTGRGSQKKGDLILAPQVLYQQQGMFQQFNWGLYIKRKQLVVGIWARQNFLFHYDAVSFLLGYRGENIRIAYSYDLTVSELSRSAYGSHEVSAAFVFGCRVKQQKRKAVSCPSF
ncbi:MAG: type IX secretion system membrane protein PorP/SprF [Bacteroidales bacterium]|jgi:type IX secretion system PorP/SprF family membrane protein|nr:type IX secretion system membrane protein PorP/SprF [Bacteroidales bacterium]